MDLQTVASNMTMKILNLRHTVKRAFRALTSFRSLLKDVNTRMYKQKEYV